MLQGLTALQTPGHYYRAKATDREEMKFPNAEHPIVRTHPVTGRQGLYVNRGFTLRIPQLRKNESDALLEMLYRHLETPEFQCRFQWRANSVAFWDNRCVQHHAMFDYFHRRYGIASRYAATSRSTAPEQRKQLAPLACPGIDDVGTESWAPRGICP